MAVHEELRVVAGDMADFLDNHVRARALFLSFYLSLAVRALVADDPAYID